MLTKRVVSAGNSGNELKFEQKFEKSCIVPKKFYIFFLTLLLLTYFFGLARDSNPSNHTSPQEREIH